MKTLKRLLCFAFALIPAIICGACSQKNNLDLALYLSPVSYYKLNGSKDSIEGTRDSFISEETNFQSYSVVQFNTDKNWTYGLTLETLEFDVYLNQVANVDIDITISALENAENYNSSQDEFFYHKTLSFNSEMTHVKLDINDVFVNKTSTISLEIDTSCYNANPELKISINGLVMSGYHEETNY